MLYVRTKTGQSAIYHANEDFKSFMTSAIKSGIREIDVDIIMADGHELDKVGAWIEKHKIKIPIVPWSCVWHGDMAKFIYSNLY
jgi:hypothetical protein